MLLPTTILPLLPNLSLPIISAVNFYFNEMALTEKNEKKRSHHHPHTYTKVTSRAKISSVIKGNCFFLAEQVLI